jgi:hypothetical protein
VSKFKIGDRVRVIEAEDIFLKIGEIGKIDNECSSPGRVGILSEDPSYRDGVWTINEDKLELVEEDVITEAIKELKGETAFGDVVISATYSIEVKGVTLAEGLKFEQMYELREALNKIVKL